MILKKKNKDGSYVKMYIPNEASWPEVVSEMVHFLQGCGYIVKGIEIGEYLVEEYGFQREEEDSPKTKKKRK